MDTVVELAQKHKSLLLGVKRETEASLQQIEHSLGVTLPEDVRWFLISCGYGPANAIPNIARSVSDTERFRRAVGIPKEYVVLEDRNDSGAVLLDTNSPLGAVLWVDTHALVKVGRQALAPNECEHFPNFASWVACCIEMEADENAT